VSRKGLPHILLTLLDTGPRKLCLSLCRAYHVIMVERTLGAGAWRIGVVGLVRYGAYVAGLVRCNCGTCIAKVL
jgi:hypothetical protein